MLLIGNIANNAFYTARLLRRAGIEADVLCYNDYSTMASPEWEEAEFDAVPESYYYPDWWSIDLHGYQRPRWFAQGPFNSTIAYLRAWRGEGDPEAAWAQLESVRQASGVIRPRPMSSRLRGLAVRMALAVPRFVWALPPVNIGYYSLKGDRVLLRSKELVREFRRRFPIRPDRLRLRDLMVRRRSVATIRPLLEHYDIIQGFSVDPEFPLLAGFHPYTAFEHGTLRDSPEANWEYRGPFQDSALARRTALAYACADWVFITNADCLGSAKRLGIERFTPMPHPYDESFVTVSEAEVQQLRARFGGVRIFFCPLRHDWVDKGTDLYIRALPALRQHFQGKLKVLFTPWGREIERSKALIAELGCQDIVEWVGPFGRLNFVRWMTASDVVFDQLVYVSLSGVSSKALSCGTPVIGRYDHAVLSWMFPEPAPMLQARDPEEIVRAVIEATQTGFKERHSREAKAWFQKWHSGERVTSLLVEAYRKILEARQVPPK